MKSVHHLGRKTMMALFDTLLRRLLCVDTEEIDEQSRNK